MKDVSKGLILMSSSLSEGGPYPKSHILKTRSSLDVNPRMASDGATAAQGLGCEMDGCRPDEVSANLACIVSVSSLLPSLLTWVLGYVFSLGFLYW